jgi:hypothetical protein
MKTSTPRRLRDEDHVEKASKTKNPSLRRLGEERPSCWEGLEDEDLCAEKARR